LRALRSAFGYNMLPALRMAELGSGQRALGVGTGPIKTVRLGTWFWMYTMLVLLHMHGH
jgi:hypothetical protein